MAILHWKHRSLCDEKVPCLSHLHINMNSVNLTTVKPVLETTCISQFTALGDHSSYTIALLSST